MSQAFINAFNRHCPKIGWPVNYVHKWTGSYGGYRVYLQDFQGDMNASAVHFGWNGQTALIYNNINDSFRSPGAYLVKEGMWDYYRNHDGPSQLGEPFTEEIPNLRYATNKQPYQAGDAVKAGDTITVQKFNLVKDGYNGLPLYENQRRTLVYNNTRGGSVVLFPVGEFSVGGDNKCPDNEQVYFKVDSNPAHDIPWPILGKLTPTGKWFTKPGNYNFVIHRANSWQGVTVEITEGNEQNIGGTVVMPQNLTATAETPNSIRLAFTLPAGLIGYNIRVYQNSQKVADLPATENTLITGLSPSVNYCFRVSAVDNVSGAESGRSAEACATTLSVSGPGQGFTFNRTTTCKNVDADDNPINETTVFYNSNNYVYSWIELNNVYGVHDVIWRWFDPGGNMAYESFLYTDDPADGGYQYWDWSISWCPLEVASKLNYGAWQVRTYVDGKLAAADTFTLAVVLSAPANLTVSPQNGPKVIINWQASAKTASYRIYRDEAFLAETASLTYTDTAVQYATTYRYKVLAANAGYQSPFSETKTALINSPDPPSPPTDLRALP